MVYQNKIYEQFLNQDDNSKDAIEKLDIKMFKMQKNIEESANQKQEGDKSKSSHSSLSTEIYSLNQLINKGPDFLKNQIFTTKQKQNEEINQWTYVQIIISKIDSTQNDSQDDEEEQDKILVQIIDYSDRFLFNSMKEEQNFS